MSADKKYEFRYFEFRVGYIVRNDYRTPILLRRKESIILK